MNKEINLNDKLGKIQKPSVENILGKKKVYVCILIQAPLEAPKELHDIIQKYWDAVETNLSNLEKKAGVIIKIFVEGIPGKGEDVSMGGKEASLGASQIAEIRTKSGAIFEQLEDKDFRKHCYNLICDKVILKYEKNFGIDDVVVEEELSE